MGVQGSLFGDSSTVRLSDPELRELALYVSRCLPACKCARLGGSGFHNWSFTRIWLAEKKFFGECQAGVINWLMAKGAECDCQVVWRLSDIWEVPF